MKTYYSLENLNIAVLGAKRSGISVAHLLKKRGNTVLVSDSGRPDNLDQVEESFTESGITYEWNGHSDTILNSDLIVLSPGVPSGIPVLIKANEKGIPLVSELDIAFQLADSPVIAVTGSNGKTTTTALISHILKSGGLRILTAGNIGVAYSACHDEWQDKDYHVLEVSSFQLDHIDKFNPQISILLNITPDHLDRYKTFNHYVRSKFRIAENQKEKQAFIYNADDMVIAPYLNEVKASKLPFSLHKPLTYGAFLKNNDICIQFEDDPISLISVKDIPLKGNHNLYNVMAASLAAISAGVEFRKIKEGILSFSGVEHRLEFVSEIDGVQYYNDSKSTNLDSLKVALDSFSVPIHLIAGGIDKGNEYKLILKDLKKHVSHIYAIGRSADKIKRECSSTVPVTICPSLQTAIQSAKESALAGEVVLLSPACSSFDMFDNYEHRGISFKKVIKSLETDAK